MALITCPGCGNKVSDKAMYCPKCGRKINISGKVCMECGTVLMENEKECHNCGCPVERDKNNVPTFNTYQIHPLYLLFIHYVFNCFLCLA